MVFVMSKTADDRVQTAAITESQKAWRMVCHVSEDVIGRCKSEKLLVANWALEILPEIPHMI
jgi:hypothetical protein